MRRAIIVTALLQVMDAVATAVHTVQVPQTGSPLPRPRELRSTDGLLDVVFSLGAVHLQGSTIDITTRAFNGTLPGPTLAVRAGDRLRLRIMNELDGPKGHNAFNKEHHPNTTNIHLHGLHVSPNAPADDVLDMKAGPQESSQHVYEIFEGQAPGTFWAHPHHHGSVMLQAGAGAAAALLVLDPPGFLSPQLQALDDRVLVLQSLPIGKLQQVAKTAGDELFNVQKWDEDSETVLVNGALRPVLTVKPGEWQRLRLVMAGVASWAHLSFGDCETALLAKDGIYIADFPRFVPRVFLPPGGRADVVVRCPGAAGGGALEHKVVSDSSPIAGVAKAVSGTFFTIRAEGDALQGLTSEGLHPWAPPTRPAYLQDLKSATVTPGCACATAMGDPVTGKGKLMEGHSWSDDYSYMHSSPRDAVVERRLHGVDRHPYHQHTYPFQLMSNAGGSPYFKSGDWHDTYLDVFSTKAVMRYQTKDFSGPLVVHCHDLSHSDGGQIAVEWVGAESCGCDLIGETQHAEVELGGTQGEALRTVAATLCLAMLFTLACAFVRVARSFRDQAGDDAYAVMGDGTDVSA